MPTTTIKKTKCLGCSKIRGHVAGCKFISCAINVWGGNAPSKMQMSLDLQGAA